jgi:hypothetical protein
MRPIRTFLLQSDRHLINILTWSISGENHMSTEEVKKLMSEHTLDRKDYDPYAVQMKIRVGYVKTK